MRTLLLIVATSLALGARVVRHFPNYPLRLERVIDGDTFIGVVETRPDLFERVRVRIDCLYAPEWNEDGGTAATRRLQRFFAPPADAGGAIELRTRWRRDEYGRLLGEPVRGDAGFCREAR